MKNVLKFKIKQIKDFRLSDGTDSYEITFKKADHLKKHKYLEIEGEFEIIIEQENNWMFFKKCRVLSHGSRQHNTFMFTSESNMLMNLHEYRKYEIKSLLMGDES
jgi:hypothetical protein